MGIGVNAININSVEGLGGGLTGGFSGQISYNAAHRSTTSSMAFSLRYAQRSFKLGTKVLSRNVLADWLLLFRHVSDRSDDGFEERLQLRLLIEALHQFDPRGDRTLASA